MERRFGSWNKAVLAAGLDLNTGKLINSKETILYLVQFEKFKKIGITQRTIKDRLVGFPDYEILDQAKTDLEFALECEY